MVELFRVLILHMLQDPSLLHVRHLLPLKERSTIGPDIKVLKKYSKLLGLIIENGTELDECIENSSFSTLLSQTKIVRTFVLSLIC